MTKQLAKFPLHLGLGATTYSEPEFTGMDWYEGYGKRHEADGSEGRLVSQHSFSESWTVWEMHPLGSEAVICLEVEITVVQEIDGVPTKTVLKPARVYSGEVEVVIPQWQGWARAAKKKLDEEITQLATGAK